MLGMGVIDMGFGSYTDPRIRHALRVIQEEYGITASVDLKNKDLFKFGRNEAVGTAISTIMTLAGSEVHETYVASDLITHFASGDAGDTSIPITVEGHTLSGGNLTFVSQNVTTDASSGRTKTALTTPLARITRAFITGSTTPAGPIYFAQDVTFTDGVPQTNSAIHLTIPAGETQSQKASTSISSTDFWLVSSLEIEVLEKTASFASMRIESRTIGNVFRPKTNWISAAAGGGGRTVPFDPFIIIPSNSDVRLVAQANTASIDVSGAIQGYLAQVVS